ncbi:MAG TPA: nuclear transport factor 2 family protein [Acidimicrobiia bacterium]|nr:nuclear transport factor 2 family protein [Acidimicrobiia bacterium]
MSELEARLRRIEDRQEIHDLVLRYGFLVDDKEVDAVAELFAPDARLATRRGSVKGEGRAAIRAYFTERLALLGPTNHVTHGTIVTFGDDPDLAAGLVGSHAEVWVNGHPMLAALRYDDTYRRIDGRWHFQERIQGYMYYVDVREYPALVGETLRVRAAGVPPQPADWPERDL